MRERGLKRPGELIGLKWSDVAPHAGAWIETFSNRWLSLAASVAPHAGAWIETKPAADKFAAIRVAPHAGAWIETQFWNYFLCMSPCRSPCGSVD